MNRSAREKHSHSSDIVDPLGVIEHCARRLWEDAGKPCGSTWKDYFADAELLLLAGRSDGGPLEEKPVTDAPLETIPRAIWALRDQDADPFAAALAQSIDRLLTEHESYCFGLFLLSNEFKLEGEPEPLICYDEQTANLLAALSEEYDQDFIEREGGSLADISIETRVQYWLDKIRHWRERDEELHYTDRNTIERLRDALRAQPIIESIRLRKRQG